MSGRPKTHCGRWIPADWHKHDAWRLVCTKAWGHSYQWHFNERTGWGWDGYAQQPVPRRDWRCNGDEGRCRAIVRGTEDEARVKGWRIGVRNGVRDPLCPTCGKPDPVTAAPARDLERSIR